MDCDIFYGGVRGDKRNKRLNFGHDPVAHLLYKTSRSLQLTGCSHLACRFCGYSKIVFKTPNMLERTCVTLIMIWITLLTHQIANVGNMGAMIRPVRDLHSLSIFVLE